MRSISRRKRVWLGLALLAVGVYVAVFTPLPDIIRHGGDIGGGASAQLGCAALYMGGRDLAEFKARDLDTLNPLTRLASLSADPERRTVTSSIFGLITHVAIYRPGVGCTLVLDAEEKALQAQADGITTAKTQSRPDPWPVGDRVDLATLPQNIDRAALMKAVDGAFEDTTGEGLMDTRAVIVVHDGRIVAEKYAKGFNDKTLFLGWSASKSVTGALVGTLVSDGKLALDQPAPVPEWSRPDDPRHRITIRNLMNMASGLEFTETYEPGDDATRMLFGHTDMAHYAASKPLIAEPGTKWSYSSGTTNILSRIVQQQTGGTLASYHRYAQERLFQPAGMTSAIFEPDASGVFVGSSYLYATARDWARFGLLYLNDGMLNGRQILSPEWVAFSRQAFPQAPRGVYAAQFWANAGDGPNGENRPIDQCPKDMYSAMGHNYQVISIVPSRKTVIVRLGWTTGPYTFDINRHFCNILKAIH